MRTILIFGAGRSTLYLIEYLLNKSQEEQLQLIIADLSPNGVIKKFYDHPKVTGIHVDVHNTSQRQDIISKSTIVVSMLPPQLHIEVAKDCIRYKKHLVTASYISKEMYDLDQQVKENNLIFMNEVGLDPGIDHMSAMRVIDHIREKNGKILSFKSYCGGLIAPESDTNSWHYKFTWNPRNVVLAGQGGVAKFKQNGEYKYIPYQKLFRRITPFFIKNYGSFEVYANRDSLKHQALYGLEEAHTFYRGTLRRLGFCKAWDLFLQLGMTDDSYNIENLESMSYRDFMNLFVPCHFNDSLELRLCHYLNIAQDDLLWTNLFELGFFDPLKKIGLKRATPAQILEKILLENWSLENEDKDMVVMYHAFEYMMDQKQQELETIMVLIGEDHNYTAMAKTVGLPVAITTLLLLNGKVKHKGVQLPTNKEIYIPVLNELEKNGIVFT